jgi:hypothetical protein
VDEDDVENKTNSPEREVSKIRRKIWANENDKNDIDDIDDDSEHGGSRINENKRKRMTTITVNRVAHGLMR